MNWNDYIKKSTPIVEELKERKKEYEKNIESIESKLNEIKNLYIASNREFNDGDIVDVTVAVFNGKTKDIKNLKVIKANIVDEEGKIQYYFVRTRSDGGFSKRGSGVTSYVSIKLSK